MKLSSKADKVKKAYNRRDEIRWRIEEKLGSRITNIRDKIVRDNVKDVLGIKYKMNRLPYKFEDVITNYL